MAHPATVFARIQSFLSGVLSASVSRRRHLLSGILVLALIPAYGGLSLLAGTWGTASSTADEPVRATGPEGATALEDRVEISWTTDTPIPATSRFVIRKGASQTLLAVLASTENVYDDFSPVPGETYNYCVSVRPATGDDVELGCAEGGRRIIPPSGFTASDGLYDDQVLLNWTDHSEIEAGYNIYREGGQALRFDGVDDYVSTAVVDIVGSFTFEFWAKRSSAGTNDFILNIESPPLGDPVRRDLEIGWLANGQFSVGFGTDLFNVNDPGPAGEWGHWAVVYDAPARRRIVYRDGALVAYQDITFDFAATGELEFGRRRKAGNASTRAHFHGTLDEVRLWNRALSSAEVVTSMSSLIRPNQQGLVNYWPMDAETGSSAVDVIGTLHGTLRNFAAGSWTESDVPPRYAQVGADITNFSDRGAVPGFIYTYFVAAFEDANGDGRYTAGIDYESDRRTDTGWRAKIAPPGNVVATDGLYVDRVRITWTDRSSTEEGFRIFRDGTAIGTVAANQTQFYDLTPTAGEDYDYCVQSFGSGNESIKVCDTGRAGGLAAPTEVAASDREFDDRVRVTWKAENGGRDGFRVKRDGVLVATVAPGAREYVDRTAVAETEHNYCVLAFSNADELNPSFSDESCDVGTRAAVLDPTGMAASKGDFEERVDLRWTSNSTSVMLYLIERDETLIEILDHNRVFTSDRVIASDTEYNYCVIAATVVSQDAAAGKATVAQVLQSFRATDAVAESSGLEPSSAEVRMNAVFEALGLEATAGKAGSTAFEAGYFESAPVCDDGFRSLLAPNGFEATLDDHESHVRLEWTDNSNFETGYRIYRTPDGGAEEDVIRLGPNRMTHSDYTGEPGVTYRYRVEAVDDHGKSKSATVQGRRTLKPPTQFTASDGTSETTVRLSWKDNSAAELGYRVYRRAAGSMDAPIAIGTTGKNETAYNDVVPTADRGVRFEYKVAAFDGFGESLAATANGRTFILAPANVNASIAYGNRIVVVWVDRSAVEDSMILSRRPVGSTTVTRIPLAANTTSYVDSDVSIGQDYEYCVRSKIASNGGEILSPAVCDVGRLQLGATSGGGNGGGPEEDVAVRVTNSALRSTSTGALLFGYSVALDGDLALIGIPGADEHGRASLYQADDLTPSSLPLETFDPGTGANFGRSVGLSGDYAIVGQPVGGNSDGGAFHVFKRSGASWSTHTTATGARNAGSSVDVVDSLVIVGSRNFGSDQQGGAIICEVESDDECETPIKLEDLITLADDAHFGASVAITRFVVGENDSLFAIVGAPGDQKAYIFECSLSDTNCDDPADWLVATPNPIASPFSGGSARRFGGAVAIDGELAVVGDPGIGAVVLYERTGAGTWTERKRERTTPSISGFGTSLAINGSTVIVGSPEEKVGDREGAGKVYVLEGIDLVEAAVYDATVSNPPYQQGRFGTSVDISAGNLLVGAPEENSRGAAYLIPDDLVPPDVPLIPIEVTLDDPTNVRASDGTAPDRIQIRWTDNAENEAGHVIFRSIEGGEFERLAEVSANVEFYDDFAASPGEAYTYCVAAFSLNPYAESGRSCDIGWRPPNGTVAGRVFSRGGAGTEDANVCLSPSVNRGLLLDGIGGYALAAVIRDQDGKSRLDNLENNFTIEAWIRPQSTSGKRGILMLPGVFSLTLHDGDLEFTATEPPAPGTEVVSSADTTLLAGQWYHIAVVKENDNDVVFYIDGTEVKRNVSGNQLIVEQPDSLWIGQIGDDSGFFEGEIDEVRIWAVERIPEQIDQTRFSALTGREESLVGYWPLDEGLRRVVPDLTRSASHGKLFAGAYVTDQGAELNVCGITGADGNFSISRIRYGESTKFEVRPTREGREFSPRFKEITLNIDSPVQNEVFFSDISAYTVAGIVGYRDVIDDVVLTCPVPDVAIHVDKSNLASDDNLKIVTEADGSFAVSVDPSVDATDTWFIMPRGPVKETESHLFAPVNRELVVTEDTFSVNFFSRKRHELTGHFSGGEPGTCGKNIGKAEIRIYTQDGCYDRTFIVDSEDNAGEFPSLNLPPLEYLMEVVRVFDFPAATTEEFQADVQDFFERLGAVEVDLRSGSVDRNLTYRAPLELVIAGLQPTNTCSIYTVNDKDGNALRTLPAVRVIEEYDFAELEFLVTENYGNGQTCNVGDGSVTIFDAISDRVNVDSTMVITDGVVDYTVFGASPNIISGARIGGIDRSFQKPITVVAQVEGRPAMMKTEWAIVEGFRERAATFVSATTERLPMMILHDPPGSNSVAFIEKGTTWCNRIASFQTYEAGAGIYTDLALGFKAGIGFSFGAHTDTEAGGGFHLETRTVFGGGQTFLLDGNIHDPSNKENNIEICATTTEAWQTSDDPGWVGEDAVMGVALNLIFALADKLEADEGQCSIDLSEVLATDIDNEEPFETVYAYGRSHIEHTLIPQLVNLVELGGDASLSGSIDGVASQVRLTESIQNWQRHLRLIDQNKAGVVNPKNYSFSGGIDVSRTESADTARVLRMENTRLYLNSETNIGAVFTAGYDNKIAAAIDLNFEWVTEEEDTETKSRSIGYTLSDGDGGDYFSVNIGKDPMFGTFVFNTVAGRSSNPCEDNTQCRDNPMITVDPPVRHNVHPSQPASFQLSLINASESNERRRYVLAVPPEKNPKNLGIHVAGGPLTGQREYVLDPGTALTVNLDAYASPSSFSYERVGVMLYPPDEWPIWAGDPRFPFERSDTAFFSVYFDSTRGNVVAAQMKEGWNWFSINSEGGDVNTMLAGVPARHGDILRSQRLESRFDSTSGWSGALTRLAPGEGYRIRLQNPSLLRLAGEPIDVKEPLGLTAGWTWVGYLPTRQMPIDVATASLADRVIEGDAIVGQNGFAQYVRDIGWVGTLRDMRPGESYAVFMQGGGELLYPPSDVEIDPREPYAFESTLLGPEWQIDGAQFEAAMTIVGEIQHYGSPLEQTTTKIAAFQGDEIRGVGDVRYVESMDRYLTFLMVHGAIDEEVPLVIHVFDGERNQLFEEVASVTYSAQSRLGQPSAPVMIDLSNAGNAPMLSDLPEVFALHPNFPNPFTSYTVIPYDLPEAAHVRIVVYDLLGRQVSTLIDTPQSAGRHRVVLNSGAMASGVYFYQMELGDAKFSGKMILVR